MPKSPAWPAATSRCVFCARSMVLSTAASSCARRPNESSAPALTSDSMTRLFSSRRSIFSQNSWKDAKLFPSCSELRARGQDRFDGVAPDVLDGREAEADRVSVRREVRVAEAHVGRLDGDLHLAAFLDVLHDVFRLGDFRRQQRRHEFDRIVRLQIRGLIGHQRVGRGVRFVEAVPGELRHLIEDLGHRGLRVPQCRRTAHKAVALLGHGFGILFSHRPPQQIGFAQRVARQHVGDPHHLFLIDDHAERILQNSLQLRQQELHLAPTPLALDEVVDHVHRARAGRAHSAPSALPPCPACTAAKRPACPAIQTERRRTSARCETPA